MIISASRRTDIPAFYAEWFVRRVRAGYCDVPNPMNPRQVARVSLLPEKVDAIVFWTRSPRAMLVRLAELDALNLPRLQRSPLYLAACADLLRRVDRTSEASLVYAELLALDLPEAERRWIERRAASRPSAGA